MKTYYVVAKRYFNDGQGRSEGTYEMLSSCPTLSTDVLQDFRDHIDDRMQEKNPRTTYDQPCMITFIHELED